VQYFFKNKFYKNKQLAPPPQRNNSAPFGRPTVGNLWITEKLDFQQRMTGKSKAVKASHK
jgi:hypothetical protein